MGKVEVDQPKGFNVVREAIRKLRFNQQIRKSSEGTKLPKVELTISIDGITIQDPKTKVSRLYFADVGKKVNNYVARDETNKNVAGETKRNAFLLSKLLREKNYTLNQNEKQFISSNLY